MKKIVSIFAFYISSIILCHGQWIQRQTPAGVNAITQFQWINKDTCYLAAGSVTTNTVNLYASYDQCQTWQLVNNNFPYRFIHFFDSKNGYFLSLSTDSFYETHDGGKTIVAVGNTTPITNNLYGMYFITRNRALLIGFGDQTALTTDGGRNWNMLPFATLLPSLARNPSFVDSLNGFNLSDSASIKGDSVLEITATHDGGKTWNTIVGQLKFKQGGAISFFNEIQFLTLNIGYCGVYKTINGGHNWFYAGTGINTTANGEIEGIYFTDSMTGYAAARTGQIYKTTNGARSWGLQNTPSPPFNLSTIATFAFANENVGAVYNESTSGGYYFAVTTNAGGAVTNGIPQNAPQNIIFNLYPNPTKQSIKIEAKGIYSGTSTITITDISGKVLINLQKNTNGAFVQELDISKLPSGIYSLSLQNGRGRVVKQFVVGE